MSLKIFKISDTSQVKAKVKGLKDAFVHLYPLPPPKASEVNTSQECFTFIFKQSFVRRTILHHNIISPIAYLSILTAYRPLSFLYYDITNCRETSQRTCLFVKINASDKLKVSSEGLLSTDTNSLIHPSLEFHLVRKAV